MENFFYYPAACHTDAGISNPGFGLLAGIAWGLHLWRERRQPALPTGGAQS